jgi:hypothetical protein
MNDNVTLRTEVVRTFLESDDGLFSPRAILLELFNRGLIDDVEEDHNLIDLVPSLLDFAEKHKKMSGTHYIAKKWQQE